VTRTRVVESVTGAIGVALVACALAANQRWLDRHFVPSFFLPRHWYVLIETIVRTVVATAGIVLAAVMRRSVAHAIARAPGQAVGVVLAAGLALGTSELVLRSVHLQPTEWLWPDEEPLRQPDPRLGWVLTPARVGYSTVGGRRIEYAIDAAGYRVRRGDEAVDPGRPSAVFVGESVMFGEGLTWEETIPAQVGSMLDMPSANLAVHGYSNDQAYLRLDRELPRFRRPLAVVSLFMTALFGRNLDDDRPRLGPGLVWLPPRHASRLASLAALFVPYRTDATVEAGIRTTGQVLRATVALARARGATPLIVVPQFGPEDETERTLRHRVLGDDLPFLLVTLDASWRLPWDRHPDARAARVIAEAIVRWFRRQ
jgi:hypothetical protein